jgi:hypothetical protein
MVALGVDGISTNRPDILIAALDAGFVWEQEQEIVLFQEEV